MASRGRGSACNGSAVLGAAVAVQLLMVGFLVMSAAPLAAAAAARYTVGDSGGWRFYAEGWAKGKTFRAGDVLEFKYNAAVHDVAAVDLASYRSCVAPKGVRKMRSGHDKVTLHKGAHYFICTEPGHCKAGMKLAVRAI
ncbi:basic blue protein-like [Oryza brachyantha]|uniref:Plantacyanin n=1 Tax=Oryza brachyantha TaxID=4533 RepID=J3LGR7_ORYBR|nr:basic blue protein-like [Oryza brachyantha]